MKVRVTVTAVVEYDLTPEYYPEEMRADPKRMLAIDLVGAEEDTFLFLDRGGIKWDIKGEVL